MRVFLGSLVDRVVAIIGLLVLSPLLALLLFLVWWHDRESPLYVAYRAARGGGAFKMVKIRSMVANADKMGGSSTASDDPRITRVGHFIRRFKIDEFSQLWNVAAGDMSLVGPRPQVLDEVELYTHEERRLLTVKPGITDFASIVFADEAEILRNTADPDLAYRRLIRPWKSRLGLFYLDHAGFWLDAQLILLTVVRMFSRKYALAGVAAILSRLAAPRDLVQVVRRDEPLPPAVAAGLVEPYSA